MRRETATSYKLYIGIISKDSIEILDLYFNPLYTLHSVLSPHYLFLGQSSKLSIMALRRRKPATSYKLLTGDIDTITRNELDILDV